MNYDIIIIGAGPAGLSFARSLADTNLKIALIEKQSEKILANPSYDGREIALTHLSYEIMKKLGMWERIPEESISLIRSAKVLNGKSSYALHFDHTETGQDNLGFMISNHLIRKSAYESLKDCKNVKILSEAEVSDITTDETHGTITLKDKTTMQAPLLVAADSRFSTTRRMMGISTSMLDFGRTCIVCKMSHEGHHNDTAYECFHYDRTLAVLPLNNKEVSLVITLNTEESETVLNQDHDEFARDIERRIEGNFGRMKLSSKLYPYPLVATYASKFYAQRYALIGDAAVGMHPVTAHGFNLGLRGAHTLAKEIKATLQTGGDIGAGQTLQRYNTLHQRHSYPVYKGTNALVKLYTKDTKPARFVRAALLRLGNRVTPAKRMIMDQLTELKKEA